MMTTLHQVLMIRKSTNNFQNISNSFNNHFLSIADTIIANITNNSKFNESNLNPLEYLLQIFNNPFPNIGYSFTSTKEIKNIIKSLKLLTLMVTVKYLLNY